MLLSLRNIKKSYKMADSETEILHGVNVDIEKGEFVAIMGPSGSGKSTLMHIIGFLDRHTGGEYDFDNINILNFDDDKLADIRNRYIGFVFQSFNLLSKTSVLENVMLPLFYSSDPEKKANRKQLAEEALASVGLSHRMNYMTNQISGGQKQRVAIARALVTNPSLILADEPTGNLDSKSGKVVMGILNHLSSQGKTIILVTHDEEVARYSDRIITIRDGNIVSDEKNKDKQKADLDISSLD